MNKTKLEPKVAPIITSEQVKQRLDRNIYNIQQYRGRSEVWQIFDVIVDQNSKPLPFASCKMCKKVLHKNKRTTSNLLNHPCLKKQRLQNDALPIVKTEKIEQVQVDAVLFNSEQVKEMLDKQIYHRKTNYTNTTSIVWNVFSIIVDQNGEPIDFVSCNECYNILRRNKRTTSNLLQHPCLKKAKYQNEIPSSSKDEMEKIDRASGMDEIDEASEIDTSVINGAQVKEGLKKNIYKLLKNSGVTKSEVWSLFSVIMDQDEQFIDFVSCDECGHILRRNNRTTSNLLQHPCFKNRKQKNHDQNISCKEENVELEEIEEVEEAREIEDIEEYLETDPFLINPETVKERLEKNIYQFQPNYGTTSTNEEWFSVILDQYEQPIDFVSCNQCNQILCKNKQATSNWLEHSCFKETKTQNEIEIFTNNDDTEDMLLVPESATSIINSETVKNRLERNIYSLRKNDTASKSEVWKLFNVIVDENGELIGYAKCNECNAILTRNRRTTSNLLQHPCSKKLRIQNDIQISSTDKTKFTSVCIEWTISNCVAGSVLEGDVFKKFIRELIEIGSKYGKQLDIDFLLPTRASISKNISNLYDFYVSYIKSELKAVKFVAISAGQWTDLLKKRTYIAVTVQYLTANKLVDRVLNFTPIDCEKTPAVDINAKIKETLESFGLNAECCVFVSDQGDNIVLALKELKRISCSSDILNKVLRAAMIKSAEFSELCKKCKYLVKFLLRSSNLQGIVETFLENGDEMNWNSMLGMFKSIKNNFSEIVHELNETNVSNKIEGITVKLLEDVIVYFGIFQKSAADLQQSSMPTLHLCFPYYLNLIAKSGDTATDFNLMKTFKKHCAQILEKEWRPELKIQHLTATFLNPRCKYLSILSTEEKQEVYNYIGEMYDVLKEVNDQHIEDKCTETACDNESSSNTKSNWNEDVFGVFESYVGRQPLSTAANAMGWLFFFFFFIL